MLQDIQEEHVDEVDFLFEQRTLAFRMLDLDGFDLTELDQRLCAHLEGLLLTSDASWHCCVEALTAGPRDRAFTSAMIAYESGDAERMQTIADSVRQAPPSAIEGVLWASCLARNAPERFLVEHLRAPEEAPRYISLRALSFRRHHPGEAIRDALDSGSWPLVRAALEAVGRLRLREYSQEVLEYARADEVATKCVALESYALLEAEGAMIEARRALAGSEPSVAALAARLLGIGGQAVDLDALLGALCHKEPTVARAATLALGNLGDPRGLQPLLELLEMPDRAGVASIALRRILGPDCPDVEVERDDDEGSDDWEPDNDLAHYSRAAIEEWIDRNSIVSSPRRLRDGQLVEVSLPRTTSPLELQLDEALEIAIARPNELVPEPRALQEKRG